MAGEGLISEEQARSVYNPEAALQAYNAWLDPDSEDDPTDVVREAYVEPEPEPPTHPFNCTWCGRPSNVCQASPCAGRKASRERRGYGL
jgi:hypothetical protein